MVATAQETFQDLDPYTGDVVAEVPAGGADEARRAVEAAAAAPLVLGNTVVLKPSEWSPIVGGTIWGEIFAEAGLPDGVLNVVTHAPGAAGPIGEVFTSHPAVRRINFTGSTRTGRLLAEAAGRNLKRVVLEL